MVKQYEWRSIQGKVGKNERKYSLKKKINCHADKLYWPSVIADEIHWFYFQDVMIYADNQIYYPPQVQANENDV